LSLPQKDQKGKSADMLLYRTKPCPANQLKPQGRTAFAPLRALLTSASANAVMPNATAQGRLVLTDFTRSFPADGVGFNV
jgi:hypothetical protein